MDAPIPSRLKAGTPGLGEASEAEIEQRAIELAAVDGRNAFSDADLAKAAIELGGGIPDTLAPEIDAPIVEEIATWDEPAEQRGGEVKPFQLDDETSVAQQLVEDGLEEADHSRRVAAAEQTGEDTLL
jgi:hypothetical protein